MDAQNQWKKACEEAADVLGAMLIESAEGKVEHSYETLAGAVLQTAMQVLLQAEPGRTRVEAAAKAMYRKLHNEKKKAWGLLPNMERAFWEDIAKACVRASDRSLLDAISNAQKDFEDSAPRAKRRPSPRY